MSGDSLGSATKLAVRTCYTSGGGLKFSGHSLSWSIERRILRSSQSESEVLYTFYTHGLIPKYHEFLNLDENKLTKV